MAKRNPVSNLVGVEEFGSRLPNAGQCRAENILPFPFQFQGAADNLGVIGKDDLDRGVPKHALVRLRDVLHAECVDTEEIEGSAWRWRDWYKAPLRGRTFVQVQAICLKSGLKDGPYWDFGREVSAAGHGESPHRKQQANRKATVTLSAGDDVTCSFENTEDATLTIVKNTVPDSGEDFAFTTDGTGPSIAPPDGVTAVDLSGYVISPGLIDAHSHSASEGINEGTRSVTAQVRIEDVLRQDGIGLFRQLAGGVTTLNILHGSANTIGGQNAVVKIRYGLPVDSMLFAGAPPGIKFALGENVRQTNRSVLPGQARRYPLTRMGQEEVLRDAFTRAREYQAEWKAYDAAKRAWRRGQPEPIPPARDLQLDALVEVLENVRDADEGPMLVHVVTKKGKGYLPAESDAGTFHGVGVFDPETGTASKSTRKTYTAVFGETAVEIAARLPDVVAVTAAMTDNTGLKPFAKAHPQRFFDVGMAEEHGVTFSAGLAAAGLIPLTTIYSTFLQRGIDQIIHDVAVQDLHVVFCIDRAGLVGEDGAPQHGSFDVTFMRMIPGMVVMQPRNGEELRDMLWTAVHHRGGPIAVRYPRANIPEESLPAREPRILPLGVSEQLRAGGDVAILALGTMVAPGLAAAEMLAKEGISATVVDARFAAPVDERAIIGLSVKTEEDARAAPVEVLDHVFVGAVFATASKDNPAPVGVDGWRRLAAILRQRAPGLPVGAISGIDTTNAGSLIEAGADGVAAISAIFMADDVEVAARELRRAIDRARRGRAA